MSFPTFDEFVREVHGFDLLPWQAALSKRVIDDKWPDTIAIPTGMGKTTCIDLAVWLLARDKSCEQPTRIWYVVDRRLLVDAAFERALLLQHKLTEALEDTENKLHPIAQALADRAAFGSAQSEVLHVTNLRGGLDQYSMVSDPSQPSIILSTVPMFASRWLFRGYGVASGMRSVHAAMAGSDSLVLLDEAHLSRPLQKLFNDVPKCDFEAREQLRPLQAVSLSATANDDADRFELTDEDRLHPVVRRRLDAVKRGRLVEVKPDDVVISRTLAEQVREGISRENCTSAVVFVNTPSMATQVAKELGASQKGECSPEVVVLTGQFREHEAEEIRDRLGRYRFAGGDDCSNVVVIATQTLEVGADYDFDFLVTEIAGVRAITQRLGRLNRQGTDETDPADSNAVICGSEKVRGMYAEEVADLWPRLMELGNNGARLLDLSPGAIARTLGTPLDDRTYIPELLPCHLWDWAKTSSRLTYEAEPAEFFAPSDEEVASVSLVWRNALPQLELQDGDEQSLTVDSALSQESVEDDSDGDRYELFPPVHPREVCEVRVSKARAWLERLSKNSALTAWWVFDSRTSRMVPGRSERLRPGDTVILSVSMGGYQRELGFDPTHEGRVPDVSWSGGKYLPMDADHLAELLHAYGVDWNVPDGVVLTQTTLPDVLKSAKNALSTSSDQHGLVAALDRFASQAAQCKIETHGGSTYAVAPQGRKKWLRVDVRDDAFDELSFEVESMALDAHLGSVGELARRLATKLSFSSEVIAALELAGQWHDAGKSDDRFQLWLNEKYNPFLDTVELMAKSGDSRVEQRRKAAASGWPKGGRHELLSARLLETHIAQSFKECSDLDAELAVHLVASHHGHGRPLHRLATDVQKLGQVTFKSESDTIVCTSDLAQQDWTQPARFRMLCEKYGYWGLAVLEWVLRSADWAASSRSGRQVEQVVR